jgi:hypothetical protein
MVMIDGALLEGRGGVQEQIGWYLKQISTADPCPLLPNTKLYSLQLSSPYPASPRLVPHEDSRTEAVSWVYEGPRETRAKALVNRIGLGVSGLEGGRGNIEIHYDVCKMSTASRCSLRTSYSSPQFLTQGMVEWRDGWINLFPLIYKMM